MLTKTKNIRKSQKNVFSKNEKISGHMAQGKPQLGLLQRYYRDITLLSLYLMGILHKNISNKRAILTKWFAHLFSVQLRNIASVRRLLTEPSAKTLVQSLVTPRFDYGNTLLCGLHATRL